MNFSKLLICPGAQKGGTTWLHRVLRRHPQFWMPPQKELDYLFHFPASREKYVARLGPKLSDPKVRPWAREWINLFVRDWDVSLYPRLFDLAEKRFSGDISPNYSRMSASEVARAAEVVRGAKVIIILRDPVERAWSHAKNASKTWNITDRETLLTRCGRFVSSAICDRMSDYPRLARNWKGQFGPQNVLILFYDELQRDSEAFINRILSFIGADPYPRELNRYLYERPNAGQPLPMPEAVRVLLQKRYASMLIELRDLLSGELDQSLCSADWLPGNDLANG